MWFRQFAVQLVVLVVKHNWEHHFEEARVPESTSYIIRWPKKKIRIQRENHGHVIEPKDFAGVAAADESRGAVDPPGLWLAGHSLGWCHGGAICWPRAIIFDNRNLRPPYSWRCDHIIVFITVTTPLVRVVSWLTSIKHQHSTWFPTALQFFAILRFRSKCARLFVPNVAMLGRLGAGRIPQDQRLFAIMLRGQPIPRTIVATQ